MVHPIRSELLVFVQATLGWAILAVKSASTTARVQTPLALDRREVEPPVRMRATITIDVDADTVALADRETDAIRRQFGVLKQRFPGAVLDIRRRRPRSSRRPPTPPVVVAPYADD